MKINDSYDILLFKNLPTSSEVPTRPMACVVFECSKNFSYLKYISKHFCQIIVKFRVNFSDFH